MKQKQGMKVKKTKEQGLWPSEQITFCFFP